MHRLLRASTWLVCVMACSPPTPTLEVTGGSLRIDGQVSLSVSASEGLQPGAGSVTVSTSLGVLDATELMLVDGAARTTLRCPRATPGCVAGGQVTVTARWNRSGGVLTATTTLRLTDPTPVDGGSVDAGADAGPGPDGGAADGGFDGGPSVDLGSIDLSMASPLDPAIQGVAFGYFSPTRTIGFAPFGDGGTVRLGFDSFPENALLVGDRLVYLRQGALFAWVEDQPDAGATLPMDDGGLDAGPDAGLEDDGGLDAGLEDDGGLSDSGVGDAGPGDGGVPPLFPLFAPQTNDFALPLQCTNVVGLADSGVIVRMARSHRNVVWVECQARADAGSPFFRPVGGELFGGRTEGRLLAAGGRGVLVASPDGGLAFETRDFAALAADAPIRQYDPRSARAVGDTAFELLSFDPNSNQCRLMRVDLSRTGTMAQLQLTDQVLVSNLPRLRTCLSWRFVGTQDLLASSDPSLGVIGVPFLRLLADGGFDAGSPDAGRPTDAGVTQRLLPPGPPSDLTQQPPRLSIDFNDSRGLEVLTR